MDEAAIEKAGIAPISRCSPRSTRSRTPSRSRTRSRAPRRGLQRAVRHRPDAGLRRRDEHDRGHRSGRPRPARSRLLPQGRRRNRRRCAPRTTTTSPRCSSRRATAPTAAKDEAAEVIALETEIAKVSKDKVARRDPKGTYNKIDRAGVAKAMAHFDWDGVLEGDRPRDRQRRHRRARPSSSPASTRCSTDEARVWRNYLTAYVLVDSAQPANEAARGPDVQVHAEAHRPEGAAAALEALRRAHRRRAARPARPGVRERQVPGPSKAAAEEQVHAISPR